jgi:hypothetical protein
VDRKHGNWKESRLSWKMLITKRAFGDGQKFGPEISIQIHVTEPFLRKRRSMA